MRPTPLRHGLFALGWTLLAGACISGVFGLWLFASTFGLIGEARIVEGVVVDHRHERFGIHDRTFAKRSVVRFSTDDGRSYTITENMLRRHYAIHALGEKVKVRYHPAEPQDADVVWPLLRSLYALGLMAAAALCAVLGSLLLLLARPRRARTQR